MLPLMSTNAARSETNGQVSRFLPACLLGGIAVLVGCRRDDSEAFQNQATRPQKSVVIAQGLLLPKGGTSKLVANPEDIVHEVRVQAGDNTVDAGDELVVMRSTVVRQAQLATLHKQQEEAKREYDATVEAASLKSNAAELKLQQTNSQRKALARQEKILELAKAQVEAAKSVLEQMHSIATNTDTREFIGQIEIDRQRVSVGEAELAYQQQLAAHQKAQDDLGWAIRGAEQEFRAAQSAEKRIAESAAVEILALEIAALEQQIEASRVIAPISGTILSVNAKAGEATGGMPIIEMGDVSQMVCEVEIDELDAGLIEPGQAVTIRSRAFGQTHLAGSVREVFSLIGRPQLRPLDPVARVDFRAVTAVVDLDASSAKKAAEWIQLQVVAEIQIKPASAQPTGDGQ